MATSYANPGGTGDRRASITTSWSSGLFASGDADNLINGVTFALDCWFNAGLTTAAIKFDFGVGVAKTIDTFRWYQSNNTSHGSWQWYGSNDDATYTALGSSFSLEGPSGGGVHEITEPSGNTNGYRYYQMQRLSGNTTSAGPFLYEIEFKIDTGVAPPPPSSTIIHASQLSRIFSFAQVFTVGDALTGPSAPPIRAFLVSVERGDTLAGTLTVTDGADMAATEAKDVVAVEVAVVTVPVTVDGSEFIYGPHAETAILVSAGPIHSPFVIPFEDTIVVVPLRDA